MKIRLLLLVLLPLFISVSASAQNPAKESYVVFPQRLDAQGLLLACNASAMTNLGRAKRRYCSGFISGVEEAARLLQADSSGPSAKRICMPPETNASELRDAYTRYAKQHDEMNSNPAAQVVLRALQQAYPCNKQAPVK